MKTEEDKDYSVMTSVELKKLFPGKKVIQILLLLTGIHGVQSWFSMWILAYQSLMGKCFSDLVSLIILLYQNTTFLNEFHPINF